MTGGEQVRQSTISGTFWDMGAWDLGALAGPTASAFDGSALRGTMKLRFLRITHGHWQCHRKATSWKVLIRVLQTMTSHKSRYFSTWLALRRMIRMISQMLSKRCRDSSVEDLGRRAPWKFPHNIKHAPYPAHQVSAAKWASLGIFIRYILNIA